MKIIRQNNIGKLLLVFVVFFCLLGSWIINIHQTWFYLTPMENLGSPPKQAVKIVSLIPIYDEAINKYRTYVFVQTKNNEVYRCCSWYDTKDWVYQKNYQIENKQEEIICANQIRKKWGISEMPHVINSLSLGWPCEDEIADTYSIFQIEQDGTIRGKTVVENPFMYAFSVFHPLCIRPISLMAFIWMAVTILIKRSSNHHNQENNEQIS